MTRPKAVTITLTPKQREQIRKLVGGEHAEVRFERVAGRTSKVAAKASLARKTPLSGKLAKIPGSGGGEPPTGCDVR